MAPTVIQPRMYKQRFRHAMKNYFLILPSKETPWIVLRNGLKTVMVWLLAPEAFLALLVRGVHMAQLSQSMTPDQC